MDDCLKEKNLRNVFGSGLFGRWSLFGMHSGIILLPKILNTFRFWVMIPWKFFGILMKNKMTPSIWMTPFNRVTLNEGIEK